MCHTIVSECFRCRRYLGRDPDKIDICDSIRRQQRSFLVMFCCVTAPTRCPEVTPKFRHPKATWMCTRCRSEAAPVRQPPMAYVLADRRVPGRDTPDFRTHEREGERERRHRAEATQGAAGGAKEGKARKLQKRKEKNRAEALRILNGDPGGPHARTTRHDTPYPYAVQTHGRSGEDGNASSVRRFSVGEHTYEYYATLQEAYRARGAPSRTASISGRGLEPSSASRVARQDKEDSPPPLNLAATRYVADRRNAHLDHAHVLAAEQVSAARAGPQQNSRRPDRPRSASTTAVADHSRRGRRMTPYPFPISILSPRPVRPPVGAELIENAAKLEEERVDEDLRGARREGASADTHNDGWLPCPPTSAADPSWTPYSPTSAAAVPSRAAGTSQGGGRGGSCLRVPRFPDRRRCVAWLADDDCLVMCSPGRCPHAASRQNWLGRTIGSKPRSASESSSFKCATSAKVERNKKR